jgi:hypothetical protein
MVDVVLGLIAIWKRAVAHLVARLRFARSSRHSLLTRPITMSCALWRVYAGCLGAILTAVGCEAVNSPSSSVVANMGTAASSSAPWLESATLTYVQSLHGETQHAPPLSDGVVQASHVAPASDSDDGTQHVDEVVSVLAIRYPHPEGRRDHARAELVLADASVSAQRAEGWRARLGRFIDSATPGVEWGPGIRDAKGLDVSIVELQMMLATAEQAANSGHTAKPPAEVQATVEINGKNIDPSAAAALKLHILSMRVAREGKVISYPGSAADLLGAASSFRQEKSAPTGAVANPAVNSLITPAAFATSLP